MSRSADRLQDEISVLEYRAGDVGALERLISRWQSRIYYYVLRMTQDETEAWDLSQEVWLSAISMLGRLRHVENFSAWLYRIAHNKAVSYLRKRGRFGQTDVRSQPVEKCGEQHPDSLCAAEDARLVRECFQVLPLAQRESLSLFYVDGLSVDEIAHAVGVPRGTVQSRLHCGRIRLKELLLKKGYSHEKK